MQGFQDFVTEMTTTLVNVAPVYVGKRNLGLNVAPPAYEILPARERYGTARVTGGGNPRMLHARELDVEIRSWGEDYAVTERLNACAITALRQVLSGINYRLDSAEWLDPQNEQYGAGLQLTVTLLLGLPQMDLATSDQNDIATATITSVDPDTSGAVQGDGILQCGETT